MRNIQRVLKVYLEADAYFQGKETKARRPYSRQQWSDKRNKNDQAYFVLLFAQLEDYINGLCRKLVTKKQAAGNWKLKRLWDNIDVQKIEQVPFMQRVALLADKSRHIYGQIDMLYKIRCKIAHEGNYGPINIPSQAMRMHELAKQLKG